jgi:hypothetical protein
MAPFALFSLCDFLAATETNAKGAPPPSRPKTSSAIIPFADFDAGEHSYSIGFIIDHPDRSYFYDSMHTVPLELYTGIVSRCTRLGNITLSGYELEQGLRLMNLIDH